MRPAAGAHREIVGGAVVGSYDKAKIDKLPINDPGVQAAVQRSRDNQPDASGIPRRPQTTVHQIIEDLLKRRIITLSS